LGKRKEKILQVRGPKSLLFEKKDGTEGGSQGTGKVRRWGIKPLSAGRLAFALKGDKGAGLIYVI